MSRSVRLFVKLIQWDAMTLELKNITRREGAATYIYDTSLSFADGSFNVLLGATRSGKTTLMQLMAGIQKPTSGTIIHDGKVIVLDEEGDLARVTLSPEGMKVRWRVPLLKAVAWTAPTLVGTKLYVRDRHTIVALDLR